MMPETLYLRETLSKAWQGHDVFDYLRTLDGEIFRDKEGRRTLRFSLNGQKYFLKYHAGVGWKEIFKNLVQFRMPILSARNEWQAVKKLHELGIGTMTLAGYGERGWNPAKRQSFVITEDLTHTMSLEHLGQQWLQRSPSFQTKYILIQKLAKISRSLHSHGMTHRDYYLCHFLLDQSFAEHNTIDQSTRLHLIDLHRTLQHTSIAERWVVKDLGSLYFSAHEVPLTQRDLFRFMMAYSQKPLKDILKQDLSFWESVLERSHALLSKWQRNNV